MLTFEKLETRDLMCCDVNGDYLTTSLDVLAIINAINAKQNTHDINKDGYTTPIDVLIAINYVNKQPRTIFTVTVLDSDTVCFTNQQVLSAIDKAFEEYEAVADVGFVYTPNGQIKITTQEIYLGNGLHGRGYQNGNTLLIHDGIIAPYHHSGRNGPVDQTLYYQVFASEEAIQGVLGHEFGHYLGLNHVSNTQCKMHSNAPVGFCPSEISYLQNRFGKSNR